MPANMIISRDHKTWYVMSLKIAPLIPLYHLEQIKQLLAGIIKLANTLALIKQAMSGKPLDPVPFKHLYNVYSDLVRDIE
eukprot:948271-Ditylum_brightwellii.AAC.1